MLKTRSGLLTLPKLALIVLLHEQWCMMWTRSIGLVIAGSSLASHDTFFEELIYFNQRRINVTIAMVDS